MIIHYLPAPADAIAPYAYADPDQPVIRLHWLPVIAIVVTDEGMPDPRGPFAVRTFAMVQKHPSAPEDHAYNWFAAHEWCTPSSSPEMFESAARAAVSAVTATSGEHVDDNYWHTKGAQQLLKSLRLMLIPTTPDEQEDA